jgi:hypothetical protein
MDKKLFIPFHFILSDETCFLSYKSNGMTSIG